MSLGIWILGKYLGRHQKTPKCWLWYRLAKLHISPSAVFESWLEAGKGVCRQLQTFHDAVINFPSAAEFFSLLSPQQLMSLPHLTFSSRPAYAKKQRRHLSSPCLTFQGNIWTIRHLFPQRAQGESGKTRQTLILRFTGIPWENCPAFLSLKLY